MSPGIEDVLIGKDVIGDNEVGDALRLVLLRCSRLRVQRGAETCGEQHGKARMAAGSPNHVSLPLSQSWRAPFIHHSGAIATLP